MKIAVQLNSAERELISPALKILISISAIILAWSSSTGLI